MGSYWSSEADQPTPQRVQPSNQTEEVDRLRAASRRLRDQAGEYSQRSQSAYKAGNHQEAKSFSQQAKDTFAQADAVARQAADLTFRLHNERQPADTVDLHGLTVREALERVDKRLQEDKARGADHVVLIVGAGRHSQGGLAKIKPAVEDLLVRHKANFTLGEPNEGCITVRFTGYQAGWWDYLTSWTPSSCVIS